MEVTRIFDLLDNFKEKYGYKDDVIAGKEDGKWIKYNIHEYIEKSELFSTGLLAMGLKKGDKIVSIINNRPEWNFIDIGASQAGIIHIPVYPTISKEDYTYILNHCKPKFIIVSDVSMYDKISPIADLADIHDVYSINTIKGVENWKTILDVGKYERNKYSLELQQIKAGIKGDDLFTIIYTSGTTGFPKGVMLSHNNFISNIKATINVHNVGEESKALSILPLSHIYERFLNYHYQYKGISIYYAENMGTIGENIKEVQPSLFCSVPRVLELFFEKIQNTGHDLPLLNRIIFFWAIRIGMKFDPNNQHRFIYNVKRQIADKLVYSKIRKSLGNNLTLVVSGGASLQTRLAKMFWAFGIKIIEGYGLTETSPVIAVNDMAHSHVMVGTVGPVIENVKVKFAEDGEILCSGSNVMMGYYNEPELTKQVIDEEGWFHTGDIGTLEDGIYLKITDRKKEIFKLSSGKYIAPQVIENKLKESEFIEQAIVIGENQKFASALIQPNFPFLHNWCAIHKIHYHDNVDMVAKPEVIQRYQTVINSINLNLGQTEQVKRIRLVADEWSVIGGELSPTLKLKRKNIQEKYKDIQEQIYLSKNGN